MRSSHAAVAILLACAAVAGCAPNGERKWQGLTSPEALAEVDLQYYWDARLPLAPEETIERMYLLDERLYCLTSHNRLLALDASRGLWDWSRRLADPDGTVFRPVHADAMRISPEPSTVMEIIGREQRDVPEPRDTVLINTLHRLLVMDRSDGSVLRDMELPFAANTAGDTDGTFYFVGDTRGWYHCIVLSAAVELWDLTTEDLLSAPLVCHGGRVYIGGEDGRFYAADAARKPDEIWTRGTTGPITAAFHVDDRGCFVPSEDNRVYAFSPATGESLWEYPFVCEGPLRDAIQVGRNTIFQYARRDRFYAIKLTDGSGRWSVPEGRRVLSVMDAEVYLLDAARRLQVRNEVTGELRTSVDLSGYAVFADNVSAPAVYAATTDGHVACIRKASAGYLTVEDLRAAQE